VQSSTGSWLAIIVDDSWLRSSMISRMSRLSTGLSGAVPQSSRISTSDQDILRASNPIASGKVNHEVSIQAAWLPIINIFYACRKTQLGRLEQAGQPPVFRHVHSWSTIRLKRSSKDNSSMLGLSLCDEYASLIPVRRMSFSRVTVCSINTLSVLLREVTWTPDVSMGGHRLGRWLGYIVTRPRPKAL
jgi:hypothetical protein